MTTPPTTKARRHRERDVLSDLSVFKTRGHASSGPWTRLRPPSTCDTSFLRNRMTLIPKAPRVGSSSSFVPLSGSSRRCFSCALRGFPGRVDVTTWTHRTAGFGRYGCRVPFGVGHSRRGVVHAALDVSITGRFSAVPSGTALPIAAARVPAPPGQASALRSAATAVGP